MKKLLALLLALVCVVSFAACGDDADKAETKTNENVNVDEKASTSVAKTDEELATEAVESFMNAFQKLDVNEMKKYIDNIDALGEEFAIIADRDALLGEIPAELQPYKNQFQKVIDATFEKLSKSISYKINGSAKDGDNFVFDVTVNAPSEDSADVFNDDTIMNQILEDLTVSGKITEGMSEDDMMNVIFTEMADFIRNMDDFATITEETKVVVYEKDGKWVINATESSL